jgi:hypothetical protein
MLIILETRAKFHLPLQRTGIFASKETNKEKSHFKIQNKCFRLVVVAGSYNPRFHINIEARQLIW